MEIKTKQQQLQKQSDDMNNQRDRIEKEIGDQMEKVSRAQKSLQAKLNNVRSVRGQDFENTKENFEILTEVEQVKNKHLLGSL
jgi:hypothetical protein